MKRKQQRMDDRPNYYKGQLLLEEDFFAEQSYHINARRRHNLRLHGSGVVKGLEVIRRNDTSVTVQPGYAIDTNGQEIFLECTEEIDLSEFDPNEFVNVILIYQEGEPTKGVSKNSVGETNAIAAYAVILTATEKADSSGVLLAKVKLDSHKKVGVDAIDYSETQYAGTILPKGWVKMSFRPIALANIPEGEDEIPPAFRVGATEALSPRSEESRSKDKGAAGTMGIPIPPSANKIYRFRIAGSRNEGKITFSLLCGGWDPKKNEHAHKVLVEGTISGAPFLKEYVIKDHFIDPEFSTLSLWLRCTQRTAISLIAVEVGY
ncbi:MAG TPA: hypothetical protein PKM20_05720 [Nitrosomonas sp.]|nr:hypothetical protein [Nitrosomonas sp.]